MRNETVDALRAFAALSVCIYHFVFGTAHYDEVSVLREVAWYGRWGVEIFFVISGYIVPLSMMRSGYSLTSWPQFMMKRLIRLEPPYLATIGLILGLGFLSPLVPSFRGSAPEWTLPQIAGHLGYLNAFLDMPWINPVFWSLAVEFQYYLVIAVVLPALLASKPLVRIVIIAFLIAAPAIIPTKGNWFIASHLPVFAAGIVTFLAAARLIPQSWYWPMLLPIGIAIGWQIGWTTAIVAILSAVILAKIELQRIRWIAWLGAISYSLYLIHVPIGGRIVNLSTRVDPSPIVQIFVVCAALIVSIVAAYGLYVLVEKPALRWSASFNSADRMKTRSRALLLD